MIPQNGGVAMLRISAVPQRVSSQKTTTIVRSMDEIIARPTHNRERLHTGIARQTHPARREQVKGRMHGSKPHPTKK